MLNADVRICFAPAPHVVPASMCTKLLRVRVFAATFRRWGLYVSVQSSVTPRYIGLLSCFNRLPFNILSSSWLIRALCKWKVLDTVLATLGCNSPAFTQFADLSNVSVDGGVEIFKLACLVGKVDVIGINVFPARCGWQIIDVQVEDISIFAVSNAYYRHLKPAKD